MTVSDLIVAAPWIIFGVALSVLCVRLIRSGGRRLTPLAPRALARSVEHWRVWETRMFR